MNKHAYLIVAFNNWRILCKQIQLLDYPDNDIYLLVDAKSKDFTEDVLPNCNYAKLYLMDRMNIWWAEFSQVEAILRMLQRAFMTEKKEGIYYSYFHFFSGVCLPIKTQQYIHEWCEHSGKELIGIVPEEFWYCVKRVKFYWLLLDTPLYKKHKGIKGIVQCLAVGQRFLGINRIKAYNGKIYNGWDWASITHDFAGYLLEQNQLIKVMFQKSLCPSELWIHTLAMNSEFKRRIHSFKNLREGSMRYIDWERGKPYVFGSERVCGGGSTQKDYELLMESPYLFARKFDERVNFEIVEEIYETIIEKQTQEMNTNDK